MTNQKEQLDAMISYLLSLIWEAGQKLRTASPSEAGTHAKTIKTLAQAINQLQWIQYDADEDAAKQKPETEPETQPPPEPQVEPVEWDQERPQPTEEPQPA